MIVIKECVRECLKEIKFLISGIPCNRYNVQFVFGKNLLELSLFFPFKSTGSFFSTF